MSAISPNGSYVVVWEWENRPNRYKYIIIWYILPHGHNVAYSSTLTILLFLNFLPQVLSKIKILSILGEGGAGGYETFYIQVLQNNIRDLQALKYPRQLRTIWVKSPFSSFKIANDK